MGWALVGVGSGWGGLWMGWALDGVGSGWSGLPWHWVVGSCVLMFYTLCGQEVLSVPLHAVVKFATFDVVSSEHWGPM